MKKKLLTAIVLSLCLLAGCSSSGKDAFIEGTSSSSNGATSDWFDGEYDGEGFTGDEEISESQSSIPEGDVTTGDARIQEEKLVYRCNLDIETLEYTTSIKQIKALIQKYDGFIQSEMENDDNYGWYNDEYTTRSGYMNNTLEVRIPSAKYHDFVNEVGSVGKVMSKNSSVENISREYYDVKTQIEALQIEEDRLLEMLKSCETVTDMIAVEARLSEVQSNMNRLKTSLNSMDNDVTYSYVTIYLREVVKLSENTYKVSYGERLKNAFVDSWANLFDFMQSAVIALIQLFPFALFVAVVVIIIVAIVKKATKKKPKTEISNENGSENK